MTDTDKGAPAPEIPAKLVRKVAKAVLDDIMREIRRTIGTKAIEAAGVPALLARVAEVEEALHHIAEAGTDPHSARVARTALAKKEPA